MQIQEDGSASTRIIEHLADDSGRIIRRLKFTRQEADQILAEAPREEISGRQISRLTAPQPPEAN